MLIIVLDFRTANTTCEHFTYICIHWNLYSDHRYVCAQRPLFCNTTESCYICYISNARCTRASRSKRSELLVQIAVYVFQAKNDLDNVARARREEMFLVVTINWFRESFQSSYKSRRRFHTRMHGPFENIVNVTTVTIISGHITENEIYNNFKDIFFFINICGSRTSFFSYWKRTYTCFSFVYITCAVNV